MLVTGYRHGCLSTMTGGSTEAFLEDHAASYAVILVRGASKEGFEEVKKIHYGRAHCSDANECVSCHVFDDDCVGCPGDGLICK